MEEHMPKFSVSIVIVDGLALLIAMTYESSVMP